MIQKFLGALLLASWAILIAVVGVVTAAPLLPFGDVNVLVLTDVHSWIAGHGHQEPNLDADYGDVLAFYELLNEHCDEKGIDLWFVSNGDWVHGTGLDRPGDPSALATLIERMPWDAVTCGNHELYESSVVNHMIQPAGFVDWWGDRYLTSNIRLQSYGQPLGNQYKILKGKKTDVLVFGFLYNMPDASNMIEVDRVEDTVAAKWFRDALKNNQYGAILVLAHMDLVDPLVTVILDGIRNHVGDSMPIQFVTGHSHYRGYQSVDTMSTSFEAGKFLDTVGFVSFPNVDSAMQVGSANATNLFQSIFIDGNKQALEQTLNGPSLFTTNGNDLSKFITKTRRKMGLLEEIGCAPKSFYMKRPISADDSIWRLYREEVVPKMFFSREDTTEDSTSVMFLPKNSWRYDLLSVNNLIDDDIWAVAPYNDTVTRMGTFDKTTILQLNVSMNEQSTWISSKSHALLPNYILIGNLVDGDDDKQYRLYTHEFNAADVKNALLVIDPKAQVKPEPTQYTSTIIWLAFVKENWACSGLIGALPDWFPTTDTLANSLGIDANDGAKRNGLAIVISIFVIFFFYLFIVVSRRWIRHVRWTGVESFEAGGTDGDRVNDKDKADTLEDNGSSHGSWAGNIVSDADHEMI